MAPMLSVACDKPLKRRRQRAARDELRRRCLRTGAGYSETGEGSQRSAVVRAVIAFGFLVLLLPQSPWRRSAPSLQTLPARGASSAIVQPAPRWWWCRPASS